MRPIDLLPDLKIRRREQLISSLPRLLGVAVLIWVLILGGLYGWFYSQRQAAQARLADAQLQVEALEPVAQRVQQVSFLQGKVQQLQGLLTENTTATMVPVLDLLASLMPSQIAAEHISINQANVNVTCRSSQLAPIGRFQQNLELTQSIEGVQVSMISGYQEAVGEEGLQSILSGYAFTVTFVYKGAK